MKDDNKKVLFYTGFPTYTHLLACYNFLGPAANCLCYWGSTKAVSIQNEVQEKKHAGGRSRSLPPLEEFFWYLFVSGLDC